MISTESIETRVVGNDSSNTASFDFRIFAKSDLLVKVRGPNDGADTTLTLNTHFTVPDTDVDNSNGGTITLVNTGDNWLSSTGNLETGYVLVVTSDRDLLQDTDFANQDDFFGETHEDAFDKVVRLVQQVNRKVSRVFQAPDTDVEQNLVLPGAVSRASKFLAFDADGDPIASSGPLSDSYTVSSFIETVLDDANAQAARETLGFNGSGGTAQTSNIEDDAVTKAKIAAAGLFFQTEEDPSSPYAVQAKDEYVTMDVSSSNKTVSLPALASNIGRRITISKVGTGIANYVQINSNGAEIIGLASLTNIRLYSPGETVTLIGTTNEWVIANWFVPPMVSTWTPTGSWISNTTYSGTWRRFGNTVNLEYKIALTGAPNSTGLSLDLPANMTLDTADLNGENAGRTPFHSTVTVYDAAPELYHGLVLLDATDTFSVHVDDGDGTISEITQANPITFASGDEVEIKISNVPIDNWGPVL